MHSSDVQKKYFHVLTSVLIVYITCIVLRIIEYFVLRTDQSFLGEAFIHKLCGIGILFLALRCFTLTIHDIGLADSRAIKNLFCGLGFGVAVFFIAYLTEILIAVSQGVFNGIHVFVSLFAVDSNTGNKTAWFFFLFCIAGNVINVIMEEGIFRGLFQKMLQQRYSFIAAAVIASILFGLWHIVGPIRSYCDSVMDLNTCVINMLMLTVTSALVGFKFAMLTKMTGSLYMAMGDHFVNNTITNILHVTTSTGTDELMFLRIIIAQSLSLTAVIVYYLSYKKIIT